MGQRPLLLLEICPACCQQVLAHFPTMALEASVLLGQGGRAVSTSSPFASPAFVPPPPPWVKVITVVVVGPEILFSQGMPWLLAALLWTHL